MAADQLRKRLSTNKFVGCTSSEEYRSKKKKLGLAQDDLSVRSNIGLKWDYQSSSVVAKKEQVSISRRDFRAFSDAVPNCFGNLSDVVTVPGELFELENLVDILSYEVWCTVLSENQRNILIQFLPDGVERDDIVQELLSGDNFHFGNPFHKWGAAVCSGKLHPDRMLRQEQEIKASKTAYYSQLHKYHNDMIDNLKTWKTRWKVCEGHLDPDEESVHNLSRKGFSVRTSDGLPNGMEVNGKNGRVEKLNKHKIRNGGGAQYMSYIKVSKEQHHHVEDSMKHVSNSSQPRSLKTVLGDLDSVLVQPLEIYEEEEKQKLHGYWLKLANADIAAGFVDWTNRKLEARKLVVSLGQEIEGRMKCQGKDKVLDRSPGIPTVLVNEKEADLLPSIFLEDEEREHSSALLEHQMPSEFRQDEMTIALEDEPKRQPDCFLQGQSHNVIGDVEEDNGSALITTKEEHLKQVSLISSNDQCKGMDTYSHQENLIAKSIDYTPFETDYPGNVNHVNIPVHQDDMCSSADNAWSAVSAPVSYYQSNCANHEFVSSSELSLSHSQVEEQPVRGISVEMGTCGKASSRDLLPVHSEVMSLYTYCPIQGQNEEQEKYSGRDTLVRQPDHVSFNSAFPSCVRNELFDPFYRSQNGLLYQHEQKRIGLDLQQSDIPLVGTSQFSGTFKDQVNDSHPLDTRERRINDLYVDQTLQETLYSDEGRYSSVKHLAINMQGWGTSAAGILTSPLSNMNGGDFTSPNWILSENQDRGAWSGTEGAFGLNRGAGSKSNSDQSLFSVVSECKELRSGAPCGTVGSSDRLLQSGVYSGLREEVSATSNNFQHNGNSLNALSEHEATMGYKVNNSVWMGMLHQNSALHESMSKMFLKSWNQ